MFMSAEGSGTSLSHRSWSDKYPLPNQSVEPFVALSLSLSLSLSLIAHSYNQTKTFGSPPPPHSHPPHECIVLRVLPHTKTVSGAGGGGGPHKPYYRSFTLQMAKGRARARVRVEGLTVYVMSGWLVRSLPFP